MYPSAYDLKGFYNSRAGRVVRRLLRQKIAGLWPDTRGLRVMGVGYPTPYLRPYMQDAERVFAVMPGQQGAHHWPSDEPNLVCLGDDAQLPLETNSIDRILMVHQLEYGSDLAPGFAELWRVLKSTGRLMIVVPNRLGLWARADWTPFGQGRPYSAGQVEELLKDNLFVHERTEKALFVPPFRRDFFLGSYGFYEQVGPVLCHALGGVHVVEASKQLYAGTGKLARARSAVAQAKTAVAGAPEAAGRVSSESL